MKYATKENVTKLLKIYTTALNKCKGKDIDEQLTILEDKNISDGICAAFHCNIKNVLYARDNNIPEIEQKIFAKEFKVKDDDFNWVTPDQYWLINQSPSKGLVTRIRHLEKLLNKISTTNNISK